MVRSWVDSAPVALAARSIEGSDGILGPRAATSEGHLSDRAIVDSVLAGDRDAFRVLVDREAAPVIRACHRILGDLHEAEDAAQEAFVTAYRSLATWRADGPFGAWLTRIAVRIAIRQAGRRKSVTWLDVGDTPSGGDETSVAARLDAASIAAASRTDPSAITVRAERASAIRHAVAGLPEPYREIVMLRFFGELSLEEIAREVDRPLGTVKTHLHRGLLRLRETMTPEDRE